MPRQGISLACLKPQTQMLHCQTCFAAKSPSASRKICGLEAMIFIYAENGK
jgi:hypothetical protein